MTWSVFRGAFEDFAKATELDKKVDSVQVSALKAIMGPECKKVLNQVMTAAEATSTTAVMDKLEEKFQPVRNILYERHEFFKADQLPSEVVDQYVVRLKQMATSCKFDIAV